MSATTRTSATKARVAFAVLDRRSARALAWLLGAAALSAPGLGRAEGAAAPARVAVQIEYHRAPGAERCPAQDVLHRELTGQLGYDPVSPGAPLRIKALIFHGPGREVHATMDLHDTSGAVTWSRHLVAYNDDCKELVLNMALALRVALDPNLRVPPRRPRAPKVRPRPAAPAPGPAPAAPLSLHAGLGGVVSFGTLPLTSAGPALDFTLRYRSFSLGLEAHVALPVTAPLGGGHEVTSWLAAATLSPCSQPRHVFACALVSVGAVMSESPGLALTSPTPSLLVSAGPRAGVEVPLSGRLALRLHGDLALRLTPVTIEASDDMKWSAPAFAGLLGLHLVLKLSPLHRSPAQRASKAHATGAPQ